MDLVCQKKLSLFQLTYLLSLFSFLRLSSFLSVHLQKSKSEIENAKVSIRNIRQKANDEIKVLAKDGLSEDLARDAEASIQDLTNNFSKQIDDLFSKKEAEIMTV